MYKFVMNQPPYVVCDKCGFRWIQDIQMKLKWLNGTRYPAVVNALKCSQCQCSSVTLDFSDVVIEFKEVEEE